MLDEARKGRLASPKWRMRHKSYLVIFALFGLSTAASASISVERADYKSGILIVTGHTTKAHQTVTLDGIYHARSDRARSFHFRVRYRPHKCKARLTSGTDIFHVTAANCRPM